MNREIYVYDDTSEFVDQKFKKKMHETPPSSPIVMITFGHSQQIELN